MKINTLLGTLSETKVIEGSNVKFYFYFILTKIISFLRRKSSMFNNFIKHVLPKGSPENFVIKNSIGYFKVQPFDDSLTISSDYFENDLKKWLSLPMAKKNFVDIGANIGRYTVLSLKKYGYKEVLAFEANPDTVETLKKNIELNGITNKVKLALCGLGKKPEKINFIKDHLHKGGSRIISDPLYVPTKNEEIIPIDIIPFDSWIKENQIDPKNISFVKIDVEGYEWEVLEGMSDSLQELSSDVFLMIEISKEHNRITSFLDEFGFKVKDHINNDFLFEKI